MMFSSLSSFSLHKKRNQFLLVAALSLSVSSVPLVGMAQVSVNHSALNNLGDGHKKKVTAPKKNKTKPEKKKKTVSTHHANKPAIPEANNPQTNSTPKPAVIPTIPAAPPPAPVFKEDNIVVPLHPPAPPPMPKVMKDAKGKVEQTPRHTLIFYDNDNIDLNESMMKAVMDFADILKQHTNVTVFLNAYSHGNEDDLSTPRRVALNRGLHIRAVLINQGIPSTRIYLLAKGIPDKQEAKISPDRVEMIRSDFEDKVKPEHTQQK